MSGTITYVWRLSAWGGVGMSMHESNIAAHTGGTTHGSFVVEGGEE